MNIYEAEKTNLKAMASQRDELANELDQIKSQNIKYPFTYPLIYSFHNVVESLRSELKNKFKNQENEYLKHRNEVDLLNSKLKQLDGKHSKLSEDHTKSLKENSELRT